MGSETRRTQRPPAASIFRASCALLLAATLAVGCSKPEPWEREEPEEALKVFLAALNYRQHDVVWEFLLPDDRAVLEQRAAALEALGGPARSPADFLSVGHVISSPSEYASVEASDSDGERTTVAIVLHDERELTVEMVRREGRWYVDLPLETAQAASPADTPMDTDDEQPSAPQETQR